MAMSAKQKLALIHLYSYEITKRLAPLYYAPDTGGRIPELLELNKIEELSMDCQSELEFTNKLWEALTTSPMKNVLYEIILDYLSRVDGELFSTLCFVSENDTRSQFSKVLSNVDQFLEFLDVDSTINFLKKISTYILITSTLEKSWREDEALEIKKKMVLKTIPLLGYYAIYDLLRPMYDVSEEAKTFVNRLYPNFLRYYELLDKERNSQRGTVTFCPIGVPVADVVNTSNNSKKYQYNLNYEDLPPASSSKNNLIYRLLKSIENREHAETPILLRNYQKELCERALTGENAIIAAPTGSGKTIVAAYIIKSHFNAWTNTERSAKVLFLTPNTVILQQQAGSLQKFLGHRYEVLAAQGSDNIPLRQVISAKDVLVATPQLIVNLLNEDFSNELEEVVQSPFDLTTFTMLVLDECHRTVKNSSYAVLMRFYHRLKFSKRMKPGYSLPQVIGLTASLGVGGASNEADAVNHVVRLCASLDCVAISTVRINNEELRKYSPIVADEIILREDEVGHSRAIFVDILCDLMTLFEARLYEIVENHGPHVASKSPSRGYGEENEDRNYVVYTTFERAPDAKRLQGYLNWVSTHLRRIVPEMQFVTESAKTEAIELLEILHDLYRTIEMYQDFSTIVAYKYLSEAMTERNASLTDFSRELWKEYSKKLFPYRTSDNVLISELVKQLLANKDMDFRAIIFVRTRLSASILADLLNTNSNLNGLRTESISGTGKGAYETSTKREQRDKLQRFKNGETRVLVATSVAEEGLDVAECNLVIKYNYASNEIAHVQRRGRGRAQKSRSILITQSLKLKEQEEKNVLKEKLMNQVLCAIEENRVNLIGRVGKAREELWAEIQREDIAKSQRIAAQEKLGIVYKLLCSKCDTLLCTSKDIKTNKTQYCVCNPSFWSKTKKVKLSEDARELKYGAIAKLFCNGKNCQNSLGRVVCIDGNSLPVLSATAFILEYTEPGSLSINRRTVRKWKEVLMNYFTPDPIRNYDIAAMVVETSTKPLVTTGDGAPVKLL
ncbi:unnamed protein product [Cylicocyclus nassatus]|uniref:RNA helicase n=1 Tax=Cylicocyclus nassatus TaxID=53992 RepID=A0AA36M713_CYLNA|nr:unnamed protein product [Cylicocyclus nassatus]